jgi:hypothetical protein
LAGDGFLRRSTARDEVSAQRQLVGPPDADIHILVVARHAVDEPVNGPAAANKLRITKAGHNWGDAQGFSVHG